MSVDPASGSPADVMAAATRFADDASRLRVRRMDALTARSAVEDSEGRFSDALLSRVDLFTGKLEPLADAWDEAAAILREHARHMDELAIAARTAAVRPRTPKPTCSPLAVWRSTVQAGK